ncbi:MAG: CinA family protein [Myxococcales bacterium]|nr:CinA family protein [Myxococcales bacterium]USN50331.1 MAG: CinA family protein [Myxococcales bacterium]
MIEKIALLLKQKKQTLCVAESCTGGALAAKIISLPTASEFFLGGVVAYSESAKIHILNVPQLVLESEGAVSQKTAILMASSAQKLFASTWALSTTGFAGPGGGTSTEPLGALWIALVGPKTTITERFLFPQLKREQFVQQGVKSALDILSLALLS